MRRRRNGRPLCANSGHSADGVAEGLLAAKDALASCATALKYAEAALREAEGDVEEALARVLAGEAERALAAVERAKDELDGARAVLSFLSRSLEPGSPLQHGGF